MNPFATIVCDSCGNTISRMQQQFKTEDGKFICKKCYTKLHLEAGELKFGKIALPLKQVKQRIAIVNQHQQHHSNTIVNAKTKLNTLGFSNVVLKNFSDDRYAQIQGDILAAVFGSSFMEPAMMLLTDSNIYKIDKKNVNTYPLHSVSGFYLIKEKQLGFTFNASITSMKASNATQASIFADAVTSRL